MAVSAQARARLRRRYLDGLPRHIHELVALRVRLQSRDPEADGSLRTLGHQLAGTGASYGFPEITARGQRLEQAAAPELLAALDDLLYLLHDTLREAERASTTSG